MSSPLGIGVITYNRPDSLARCLQAIRDYTQTDYRLVIADDGSAGGVDRWRGDGWRVESDGTNRGCAYNKNRALRFFLEEEEGKACDPILLLEDDTYPIVSGWEAGWVEAAYVWDHVNFCLAEDWQFGRGTVESPFQCWNFSAECTVTSRAALERVGYLDSEFSGYGVEHVEWTTRFRWLYEDAWARLGMLEGAVPCLREGLTVNWDQVSFYNEEQLQRNLRILHCLRAKPIYREFNP